MSAKKTDRAADSYAPSTDDLVQELMPASVPPAPHPSEMGLVGTWETVAFKDAEKVTVPTESRALAPTGGTSIVSAGSEFDIGLEMSDLLVPRILLMQAMSKMVNDLGVARAGEFRDNVTGQIIPQPAEIIIFDHLKNWKIMNPATKPREFVRFDPWKPGDEMLPMEFTENGRLLERDKCTNFYCLLVVPGEDIRGAFPYVLTLTRTSQRAAKQISTAIMKLKKKFLPPWGHTMNIDVEKQTNEKGTFYVFRAAPGRVTTADESNAALIWHQDIRNGVVNATIHEDEEFPADGEAEGNHF